MARKCYKCGETKSNIFFTKGYFWCNKCLGKESTRKIHGRFVLIPEYNEEELSHMIICNRCKIPKSKEEFDLSKWLYQKPIYGKTCKTCIDRIKELKYQKKQEKEIRHWNIRRMMRRLVDHERGQWEYVNERGLRKISKDIKGGYVQMYFNKTLRNLVETQTLEIELTSLIKTKKDENNHRIKK